MAVWFSHNHRTEFSDVGTIFQSDFEDCFMDEFIAVNDGIEIC